MKAYMINHMIYSLTAIELTLVAVVQYTFTHKQYTEQHSETQNLSRIIHNNKNTYTKEYIMYKIT
jgi:hypothetical protein